MEPKLPENFNLEETASKLGIDTVAGKECLRVALENIILLNRKQHDYGPGNISGFGMFGCVVRMNDKMERIKTLFNSGRRRRAVNESIRDSFRDISNYGVIALVVDAKLWPSS